MSVTVVKCGGNAAVNPEEICRDVAALRRSGERIVLVHGGSADIDGLAGRLRVPNRRLVSTGGNTSRYTDPALLEVVLLALAGAVKPRLLAGLGAAGVRAVGLTGLDDRLLRARRYRAARATVDGRRTVVRDNHSGQIVGVKTGLLWTLLGAGIVPVVSPPAVAEDGGPVNADADRVAAAVAVALGAGALVMLTGAAGVLRDPADESSLLRECPAGAEVPFARGGMAAKLSAAGEAAGRGVGQVLIGDGRRHRPVSAALAGSATRVVTTTAILDGSHGQDRENHPRSREAAP